MTAPLLIASSSKNISTPYPGPLAGELLLSSRLQSMLKSMTASHGAVISQIEAQGYRNTNTPAQRPYRSMPHHRGFFFRNAVVSLSFTGKTPLDQPSHGSPLLMLYVHRSWLAPFQLSRIEWALGMQYDSIDLDTDSNTVIRAWASSYPKAPTNAISVCREWRDLLRSDRWVLLPSLDIMDKLWDRWLQVDPGKRRKIPAIDDVGISNNRTDLFAHLPFRFIMAQRRSNIAWSHYLMTFLRSRSFIEMVVQLASRDSHIPLTPFRH